MEHMKDLKRAHQMSVILYISFMVSLGIYVVVVEIFKKEFDGFRGILEGRQLSWIRFVFLGLGLAQIFIIRLIRQILTRGLNTTERKALIAHLNKVTILTAAFCEVPAVLGLVLFFIMGNLKDFYVMTALSFALFFLYLPRYSNWEEWISAEIRK